MPKVAPKDINIVPFVSVDNMMKLVLSNRLSPLLLMQARDWQRLM